LSAVSFTQDRRLRTNGFFMRAQATMRANGFPFAQNRQTRNVRDR